MKILFVEDELSYLTPFDFIELEAGIRTLSRIDYIQQRNELTCSGLTLNMATKLVSYNSVKLPLTKKEYAILEYLMLPKGCVISTEQLINHTWDSNADLYPDTLKYHIYSLKKKFTDAKCSSNIIQNIGGIG
jgi:DNA-binding response OmpR family regulator